ncbi:MAG: pyrR [Chitinophagaceae bacterium]|nr:pyrR [Chitinophagaceae bacterium]
MKIILTAEQITLVIKRLAHQVLENHNNLENTVIIGIQPRGVLLSDQLVKEINLLNEGKPVDYGKLDITFYRDDIRKELHVANKTEMLFSMENKNVILIDDVLYTGRTTRAALDALMAFGRPAKVELCVLINRRFSRELPIQPEFTGLAVDVLPTEKVIVRWKDAEPDYVSIA